MAKLFYSFFTILCACFFIGLGIVGLMLPLSVHIRSEVVEFILQNSLAIGLFGFGFLLIGATLLANLYTSTKRHTYIVKAGDHAVVVDEAVIQHYLNSYWQELFPKHEVPMRFTLRKNKIKIVADLPYIPKEEQKGYVERIQSDLKDIFTRILGYSQDLILSISFHPKKP